MAQPKTTAVERAAGKRATHLVYYTRGGRNYFDAIWADDDEQARERFLAFASELGWKVTVLLRVEERETDNAVERATRAEGI